MVFIFFAIFFAFVLGVSLGVLLGISIGRIQILRKEIEAEDKRGK